MSPNKNPRRTARRRRVAIGLAAVAAVVAAALGAGAVMLDGSSQTAAPAGRRSTSSHRRSRRSWRARSDSRPPRRSTRAAKKWGTAHSSGRCTPHRARTSRSPRSPVAARTGRRSSHAETRAKLGDHGLWTNLGPDNAVYPLNPFRNRYVYVPNEYVAAGRTSHSVIDPNCGASSCRYWIANAGGGIWRTDNVFASQPKWEYVSAEFQHNNTAALELDPNDSTSNMIYAGTGEPNTCRSGCIAGVGLYKSKDGGDHWSGPIGRSTSAAGASARSRSSPATRRRSSSARAHRAPAASAARAARVSTAERTSPALRTSGSTARRTAARRSPW